MMMIVAKAREYLGTPFHHQGRLKGKGIDCVGLLVGVAHELGLQYEDFTAYNERPDPQQLMHYITGSCNQIPKEKACPGDILIFWFATPDHPQHAGICTDRGFIHTYRNVGKCIEQGWTKSWQKHFHSAYRYKWPL